MALSKRFLVLVLLCVLVLPTGVFVAQSKGDSEELKTASKCEPGNDLKLTNFTHFKYPGNYREVTIGKERLKISVVDAYRLVYAYDDVPHDLVNAKLEQSDAKRYAQDKERIIKQLKNQATTPQRTKIEFTDKSELHGFEHYATDRAVIDIGEVVGTHVLFDDAKHFIITIYFLNQEKQTKKRKFDNIDEYHRFKNDVLDHYGECLRKAVGT